MVIEILSSELFHSKFAWQRLQRLFLLCVACCIPNMAQAQIRIAENTVVRFASAAEGVQAITQSDDFTQGFSRFDLQVRLHTEAEPKLEEWKKYIATQVQEWQPEDRTKLTKSWEKLAKLLTPLALPLPGEIVLVATTGHEESNAAYCRGTSIVLPKAVREREALGQEFILLHELFHVISNQHKELRRQLYPIVGFQVVEPMTMHASLASRKISNPDAPTLDCLMQLEDAGQYYYVTPVLYAKQNFSLTQSEGIFNYLQFRLMVVEQEGKLWKAVDKEGRAVVIDPEKAPSFHKQIGANTQYIIHPEEILADNFVHMVLEKPNLPHPNIVKQLKKVLQNTAK